jgi:transposase
MTQTVYCGVDFHARQQTVAYCSPADGELIIKQLDHQKDDLRAFYSQFSGQVVVGLEAIGYSLWFEELIESLGHQVRVGHSSDIRRFAKRRQKNDRRDAELILDLLLKGDFPRIHRRSSHSSEVLRQLRYRHRLVKMRTMAKNSLQAIAISCGMSKRANLRGPAGRKLIESLLMSEAQGWQREQWLVMIDGLEQRISSVERWLGGQAALDERV